MAEAYDLERFITAQSRNYRDALSEIRRGRKTSHWMWYVFPQLSGLGYSETAKFYGIKNAEEAQAYYEHPVLGSRLIEISGVLLDIKGKTAYQIFGSPDDLKLKSSMTLFNALTNADPVFAEVLDQYFADEKDDNTLTLLQSMNQ
jgi:uncharacterized protein (DUF1810 family)